MPRLSYIKEKQNVKYNPTFDANGHDFVEINGVKWATMNVGANSITDYGLYFQWGDTQGYTQQDIKDGKKCFDEEGYNSELLTKYNKTSMTLDLEDDAVHAAWGGSWRMPTAVEFQKLGKAVTTEWTTIHGVHGLLCTTTAKTETSKTLFFPACGSVEDYEMSDVGSYGFCWSSSSLSNDRVAYAYYLLFNNDKVNWQYSNERYYGVCVRGVLGEI